MKVVPAKARGRVTVVAPVVKLCPFRKEVDAGEVEVSWVVSMQTIELHSLREHLDSYRETEIGHEEFTSWLREEVWRVIGGIGDQVSVTSRWNTAGMEVSCSTSAIPVGAKP